LTFESVVDFSWAVTKFESLDSPVPGSLVSDFSQNLRKIWFEILWIRFLHWILLDWILASDTFRLDF
jgi:hypothetical protein